MKILSTGIQVSQAVKNVGRLRQILTVFGKHGFDTFVTRMGLDKHREGEAANESDFSHLSVPVRLRMCFEKLGPTFVKLGQLLSNRPDMVPDDYIEEFKKLQDNVSPVAFDLIVKQVETALGGPLNQFYSHFSQTPLASASIGQVHEATLVTGEQVVVKVQRPEIAELIKSDISILSFLASLMERYLPETRVLAPQQIVDEFFRTLTYELDFVIEANTCIRVAENFKDHSQIVIPKVYRAMSGSTVLTMEKLNGARITDVAAVKAMGINPTELVDLGGRAFFKMVLLDGLFHGDLHGGNLFAMRSAETGLPQIGVIDFGIVGRLSEKSRDAFARMMLALIIEDYESLCYEYADLAAYGSGINFEKFQADVRNTLSPYMGLSLKDVHIGRVLIEATRVAVKYNIRIPSEWMIVFKAIFTLEGLGRQLDPDFDLMALGQDLVKTSFKDRYSLQRFGKDAAFLGRDLTALLQTLPRQIRWMFRKFNSNDFAFEVKIKEVEVLRRQLERGYRGIGLSIVTASLILASALMVAILAQRGEAIPHLTGLFIVYSTFSILGVLGLFLKKWR